MSQIGESLDKNNNITKEVKQDILTLINIFHQKFPNVDLQNLTDRLSNLVIQSGSKYVYKEVSDYNPTSNTLTLNMDELNKDHDIKHVVMSNLLHIITSKEDMVGFDKDKKFVALNTGYTEILTNNLVGNDSDMEYYNDEVISTNLIANMIGNDIMFKAYFTNDIKLISDTLENAGLMEKIIPAMNFNYYDKDSSNLAQNLLEMSKVSLNNGTYSKMSALFDREVPSSKCFNDDKHKEIDNFITFNRNMQKAIISIETDNMELEETHNVKL